MAKASRSLYLILVHLNIVVMEEIKKDFQMAGDTEWMIMIMKSEYMCVFLCDIHLCVFVNVFNSILMSLCIFVC